MKYTMIGQGLLLQAGLDGRVECCDQAYRKHLICPALLVDSSF